MKLERLKILIGVVFVLLVSFGLIPQPALAITRNDVMSRAQRWVDLAVPYNQRAYQDDYREDCSGYVSYCWATTSNNAPYSYTTDYFYLITHSITKDELQPGDALNNPLSGDSGHVVLFGGWANDAHTQYVAYEETPPKTVTHIIPYPYWPGYGIFYPIRYNNIEDSSTPLYRLYNKYSGDHFYTTSYNEKDFAISKAGYSYEGIAGYVFNSQTSSAVPLYRLYNKYSGDHFYTTSYNEKDFAISKAGYTYEGIAGYIW